MTPVEKFLKLAADARTRTWEVPVDEIASVLAQPKALLIDVRETEEWNQSHPKGAIHLSRGIIEFRIQEHAPDFSTPILLCCGRGRRSALVADNLQKLGYNNVVTVAGGFEAWEEAGLPTESEAQAPKTASRTRRQAKPSIRLQHKEQITKPPNDSKT